jgi:hypothetical protein
MKTKEVEKLRVAGPHFFFFFGYRGTGIDLYWLTSGFSEPLNC